MPIYGMIGGQVVDVRESGHRISGDLLEFIYRLKTSALIESAVMTGAVLAGAADEEIRRMEEIAGKIGLAFQIQDDILDVTGTEELLGKPVHSDEKNEKTTYVSWKGLEGSRREAARLTDEAIADLRALGRDSAYLEALFRWLVYRDK